MTQKALRDALESMAAMPGLEGCALVEIEAGMVWLNSHNVRDLRSPFGGIKASGLGQEGGYRSLDFYSDQQAVHITLGDVHTARFGAN